MEQTAPGTDPHDAPAPRPEPARPARLGLGLAALGRPAYITSGRDALPDSRTPEALRARTAEVLDAAVELGVRDVDAARSYGLAEDFLASWLAARRAAGTLPADLLTSSKWGYTYVGGWREDAELHERKDHSLAALERQWPQTRALLPGVATYLVHSVTPESPALTDPALHRALAELAGGRSGGRPVIGISTSGPAQGEVVRRALEVRVDGVPLFAAVQSTWNVLEPSAGPALADAAAAGWRVVVKEGVANGRLAVAEHAPAPVRALAAELGVGVDAVVLAAAMARPWAHVVLSGAVDVAQLRSNAAALGIVDAVGGSAVDELTAAVAQEAGEYWSQRADRPWA